MQPAPFDQPFADADSLPTNQHPGYDSKCIQEYLMPMCRYRCKTDPPCRLKTDPLGQNSAFASRPMLSKEQHVEISVLVHQALSIRAIARQMGCSRNTIRRHLKLQPQRQPYVYGPHAECVGKLAPFEAFLRQRVDAARPHWIPAIALLREIRKQGWEIAPYLTTHLRCI